MSERPQNKGQKRTGKKTEPQPLVEMINKDIGADDKPMSIRHVLRKKKMDLTWMDYLARSPSALKNVEDYGLGYPRQSSSSRINSTN